MSSTILTLAGMLAVMFYMNWRVHADRVVGRAVMFLFVYVYTKRIKGIPARQEARRRADVTASRKS